MSCATIPDETYRFNNILLKSQMPLDMNSFDFFRLLDYNSKIHQILVDSNIL